MPQANAANRSRDFLNRRHYSPKWAGFSSGREMPVQIGRPGRGMIIRAYIV
jgi:hypothetical protein